MTTHGPSRPPRSRRARPSHATPDTPATAVERALPPTRRLPFDERSSAAGRASSSVSTRPSSPRNSKRRKISFSCERSGGAETSSPGSTSSGRSRCMVARSFESRAWSACSMTALLASGRELAGVLDHALERSVLRDQLAGGLVADPGDAGDVVGRVPLETDEVGHLVGSHAVAQLDALGRVDVDVRDPARRHHQAHVLGAELEGVAVGGDDARLDPRLVGARGERRDHVVRLPALELEVAVAERLHDGPEVRELLAQQVRHRAAPLLVRLGDLGAMHRPRVPRDRDAPRAGSRRAA